MLLTFPIRSTKLSMNVEVRSHLAHRTTPFQVIDVYDTFAFGKVLFLDGHVQLSELDEHAYHESLVHIPLLNVGPSARRALVVGGGDGGVLRELVKHPLEAIHMVEIDQGVIDVCREQMPEVSGGAFDDPRVEVFVEDAFPFVKQAEGEYDLIVMDSTDVYEEEEGGLSQQLWTPDFYTDLSRLLAHGGFLVTQADNLLFCPYSLNGVLHTFSQVFPTTGSYWASVPSFGGYSGYAWASKGSRLASALPVTGLPLRYLDATTYAMATQPLPFAVPRANEAE